MEERKSTIMDDVIDAAVDMAALQQEQAMAQAIWKMMHSRKGRRKPHRSFACQEIPVVAARLKAKRQRKQKLARRARKTMYRNRH